MAPTSLHRLLAVVFLVFSGSHSVLGQDLRAELDYGTFQGAYSEKYNISYWQKIPFAAPPVGQNRFRAPQPPEPITNGTYDSSQAFDMCPQRTVNGSEDCLYLGLYSRPWTQEQPLRPVVVVFYGGAFIEGSAYFTLPPSAYPVLNVSETADLVFVYPNYRVNAFGFLAGPEIAADSMSDANAGLLDQRAAIKWVNRYAEAFGGDGMNVSIWGQSAGAGSVVAQAIADQDFEGSGSGAFFEKALASSPFWPKTYSQDSPEVQWIYDTMVNLSDCSGAGDTLACLKQADVQTLRKASLYVSSSHTYNTSSYTWAPVIDGKFLPRTLSEATTARQVNMQFGFGMYNQHEGENFIPSGLENVTNSGSPPFNSSEASFDGWLKGFLPGLSTEELDEVKRQYPRNGSTDTLESYNTTYTEAGLIYRDVVLACPAYWTAGAAAGGSWLGEYTISPAKHGSDTYWWNTVNSAQQTDPLIYDGYTGAFASFFMAGNPNTEKMTDAAVDGVPPLSTGQEFVVEADGFENIELVQFKQRCDFWKSLAPKISI